MPDQRYIIGIAGGLGPYAHIDFERKLLESARAILGANEDQAYPEWILSSVPQTPDRTLAMRGKAGDPVPWLVRSLRRLEPGDDIAPGADFATIPCNTAHGYLDRIRNEVRIPIVSMIETTVAAIAERYPRARVGILATSGTLVSDVYGIALRRAGLHSYSLLDYEDEGEMQQRLVMAPIYGANGIKATGDPAAARGRLLEACELLIRTGGANVLIAACTEIPLAITEDSIGDTPLLDPTRLLAESSIRIAYGLESLPTA